MRVVVTGGAGFIGGVVCRILRERDDAVIALVREPEKASGLASLGCELRKNDLSSREGLIPELQGVDAVIHAAGSYRIGIAASERPAMWDANVGATARVLGAAAEAGAGRVIYLSTVNVLGDTHGKVVDETYRRDPPGRFLSYYDETKTVAHEAVQARIDQGAPIAIVMPGGVYGPGDHSAAGALLAGAFAGRLRALTLGDAGLSWTHVEDEARGIVAALDRGEPGRSYILAGPSHRLREAVAMAARLGGHRPPRVQVPTAMVRLSAPLGGLLSRYGGTPPNVKEVISAADGVTYFASAARAESELGFRARDLEMGLRDTFTPG